MKYNLEAIFKRMEEFKNMPIALQGGEVMCLPKKDVEALLAKIYELKGRSDIHTNATLIDDEWIEIFKKYKTKVGVSWDGPGELSAYRPGTSKVGSIIERLAKEGLIGSILIVLSKANAGTKKRLNKLKDYLLHLHEFKITGRLLPCTNAPGRELSIDKLKETYLDLADFCLHHNLKWSPFEDIINALQGKDRVCVFMPCDPFSTPAVLGILGDGSMVNCMRTDQFQGILLRHPTQHKTRDEILENVPQEYGGCKGCKYWSACYGGCSFDVIDNDWRNRTYLCPSWKALFEFYEKTLSYCEIPLAICQKPEKPVEPVPGHGDSPHRDSHGDAGHGDAPHGDSHQDHSDAVYEDTGPRDSHEDGPLSMIMNKEFSKGRGFKVDFIGIASLRCGTTWISRCLAEHPEVCFSSIKEINFFGTNYVKGLEYYKSFFKNCDGKINFYKDCEGKLSFNKDYGKKIKGEFTPGYYLYNEAPQRIKKHFPDVKMIACLRNPIEQVLSHYRYKIKTGQKVHPNLIKELSQTPRNRIYFVYGFYYQHLSRFLKYFDPENILILIYEDALNDPAQFIKSIYQFLKIDENFIPSMLHKKINTTPKKERMDKATRKMLREMYNNDIEKLEKLIGRDLSLWK
ncbi:hypothetical protein ES703_27736 [subsurface metagenome]